MSAGSSGPGQVLARFELVLRQGGEGHREITAAYRWRALPLHYRFSPRGQPLPANEWMPQMRLSPHLFAPLAASAALLMTAGCGGGNSASPAAPFHTDSLQSVSRSGALTALPAVQGATAALLHPLGLQTANTLPDFADPDAASKTALIVSDEANNVVYGLTSTGTILSRLTKGMNSPQGVALDAAGDLYVANSNASELLEYKSDHKTLLATIPTDGPSFDIAIDKKSGTIAETNISGPNFTLGNVSLYPKGQTTPCVTLSNPNLYTFAYASFDAHGNLYLNGLAIVNNQVVVFVGVVTGGCAAKTITPLTTSNVFAQAGGLRVRANGDVTIGDASSGTLYEYRPALKGSLGKPVATITLAGNPIAAGFAFDTSGKTVYDLAPVAGLVFEHNYPSGSQIESFVLPHAAGPTGITTTPNAP